VLYFLRKELEKDPDFVVKNLNDLCASVQYIIVQILMDKLIEVAQETGIRDIALAGGVSANSSLRTSLQTTAKEFGWNTYIPPLEYCTDNAAMIGITGYLKMREGKFADLNSVSSARLEMNA
jgi:N6-L-threonylcarbamoyladenine synthase